MKFDNATAYLASAVEEPVQTHSDPRFVSRLTKSTLALVMAGGRGSRLGPMTQWRAKPAVPIAGKFRIIDFSLSNCINSGIRRIGVLTQYKSHSLLRHLQRGWNFLRGEANEFIDLLPAQQRVNEAFWYRGTADAISQNIDILRAYGPEYILVLAGDHVYKQDYSLMLLDHVESGAKCTVGCIEVPRMEATALGVMHVDTDRRITAFLEKPKDPPAIPGKPDRALGSMGIYIFNAEDLYRLLENIEQGYRAGRHPDPKTARPTAKLLRALADEGDERILKHRKDAVYGRMLPGYTQPFILEDFVIVDERTGEEVQRVVAFKAASVFDVRQTEGDTRDTVVSLGKQLSRRWYVGYERGLNATQGTAIIHHRFAGYRPWQGELPRRANGVMISMATGRAVAQGLLGRSRQRCAARFERGRRLRRSRAAACAWRAGRRSRGGS